MKTKTNIILAALVAFVCLFATACTTVNTTSTDGTTTSTTSADWDTINYTVKIAVKYAVKSVLDANPDYATSVSTLSAGVETLLTGSPSLESLKAAVQSLDSSLSVADAATIASVLKDAVDLYLSKSGATSLVATDDNVKALVKAVTSGISEGVTLHNSSTIASS